MLPIEATEPMLPIDNTDPRDPIDNTDPRDRIDNTESWDHNDHREPELLIAGEHVSTTPRTDGHLDDLWLNQRQTVGPTALNVTRNSHSFRPACFVVVKLPRVTKNKEFPYRKRGFARCGFGVSFRYEGRQDAGTRPWLGRPTQSRKTSVACHH
jgi:hypothetical protein